MRFTLLLFSLSILVSCGSEESENSTDKSVLETIESVEESTQQSEFLEDKIPNTYNRVGMADGDLYDDDEGSNERVEIYDTDEQGEWGIIREARIYRWDENKWKLWKIVRGGLLGDESGGMMGDPFDGVKVENGCIVLRHWGGSREKWAYTHRYRYQNDQFELIGATIGYGDPCLSWEEYDYNLSTGKIIYTQEPGECEDVDIEVESIRLEFENKMKELPTMAGFEPGSNKLELDDDHYFYY